MLVNLKEILAIAERGKFAVGAFNATNLESLCAIIAAAEEADAPVILSHAEVHNTLRDISVIGPAMVAAAKESKVPVCVHLDHGTSLTMVYRAFRYGFTSVMYDASALTYEENLANTVRVKEIAQSLNASVEAELGRVMTLENGEPVHLFGKASDYYTRSEEAKDFVERTGVDALAIAFGTSHGFYHAEPVLDFGVVERVRKACGGVPLVMHGGSGVSAEGYRKAIAAGIRKINYYSYMASAGFDAAKRVAESGTTRYYHDLAHAAELAMKEDVSRAIGNFTGV